MGLYDAYVPAITDTENYPTQMENFMGVVGNHMQGKAPADHTHGEGTAVAGAGETAGRPASGNWIYHNTERGVIERIEGGVKVADVLDTVNTAYIAGLNISYKAADEITIQSGVISFEGNLKTLPASLDLQLTGLGNSTNYIICVDEDGDTLDSDSFWASTDTPARNSTYNYWEVDSAHRAIGVIRTSAAGNMLGFKIINGRVWFISPITLLDSSTVQAAYTALGAEVPFQTDVNLIIENPNGDYPETIELSTDGSSGYYGVKQQSDTKSAVPAILPTNTSKQIYYKKATAGLTRIKLHGFSLLEGMAK